MEKLLRKTGITISLRCLLIVASLVFGSSAWGQKIIFSETFNGCASTGGNDGNFKTASGAKFNGTETIFDNTGWSFENGYPALECVKLGGGSALGTATTPTLNFTGDATLTFRAGAWDNSSEQTTLKISISNGTLSATTVTLTIAAFTEYTINITGVTTNPTIKFEGYQKSKSRFFLDDVVITQTTSGGGGETTLTDRNLSFGETKSFDAAVGGTFTPPSLTGVTDGGVTYESSDDNVASVDANGEVTIVGMGHAQIKASAEANETYKAGSDSYDIYVYGSGTIDDMKDYITSSTAKDIYFNLTSTAVVTYAATNYAYMEDSSAGIYIFKDGHGLTAGNSFTGKIKATGTLWNQLYELTSFTPANAAGTADIRVSDWTIKDLLESENTGYKMAESKRVKLTGVTATTDGTSWTIEQDGYTTTLFPASTVSVTAGSTYDITGYPTNYNGTWEIKVLEAADLVQTAGKKEATVTFKQESYTVETNGTITVSATTNSTSAIVYSISPADSDVLIDAETGDIVAGATAGTYTITATVAENGEYTSASASCVLTVVAPAPPAYNITAPTYYKKITSTDELAVGGTYLIVCEEENCALESISNGKGLPTSITYTTNSEKGINVISDVAAAAEYLLVKNSDGSFSLKNGTKYLKASKAELSNVSTVSAKTEKWTFAFSEGNVEIVSIEAPTRQIIYRTGDFNTFKNYVTTSLTSTPTEYKTVQLYQKVTDLAISTLTKGYATFVTDVPYVMPKGACGYAVTVAPQVGVITKTEAYTEGAQVPAQTALLIGGTSGTNYYPAVLKEDVAASYTGENYMEGRRTAEGYTNSQKVVAVYYYKLALNSASKPGFYYGAADGVAFQLTKPTTAYLAVPKSSSPVNGYLIDFEGEETGIDSIAPSNGNADGAVYNLNGIRMTQTLRNLPKGVYIVNGKKVIK